MANENAILDENKVVNEDLSNPFDLDELEEKLQDQLEEELAGLEFLQEEKEKIGNPDNLGSVIKDVVWEQFINQIAVTAGEDFIKENRGLHLDLRNEAHIQTTENFAEGKIATHNDKIDYQQRYNEWQDNFQKNTDGSVKTNKDNPNYKGNKPDQKILNKDARTPFDKDRPKGSAAVHKDHTVAAAEIIRDPKANAHLDKQEQIDFANSDKNLIDLDASANMSKKDLPMTEWLDSERDGQKPADRFDIDEDELRERDGAAREEYEKIKDEGEKKSIETGKKSQKEEAFRIGGKALRAALMLLLADLIKSIIAKLIKWFKSSAKNLNTLLDSLKEAITAFIGNMKKNLINASSAVFTTVATAIIGPIVSMIKKVWIMLKQGWKSLKGATEYIRNPENKGKPIGRLMLEAGKIVMAGLTGVGAIVLGEVIEKGLMAIPIFALEMPLIGSLANILGIFLGAVVAGIIGAIAINLIQKGIEKSQKTENIEAQVDAGNRALNLQHKILDVSKKKLEHNKTDVAQAIKKRHLGAADMMRDSLEKIAANCKEDESIREASDDVDRLLTELGAEEL